MKTTLSTILLVVTFAAALSPVAQAEEPEWETAEVSLEGNTTFDEDRLKAFMVTRPAGWFGSNTFRLSVLKDDISNLVAFYQRQGFLNAAVTDTTIERDSVDYEVRVRLTIEEGARTTVEGISILGNRVFVDSTLLALVPLQEGEPFQRGRLREGMTAIARLYADSGYLDASVEPGAKINESAHLAVVDLTVSEGAQMVIADIEIQGLDKTQPFVVERELAFEEGEIVSYGRLMETQRRLYLTGLFRSVFIRPQEIEGGDPGDRKILIEIEEKLNSEFSFSVGYGSVEKLKGGTELYTNNLAGTARQIGIKVEADFIRREIEGSFTEPRTFGTRFQTDFSLFFRFEEEPSYDVSRYGGRLTVGRKFGENGNVALRYRYENAQLRHVETEAPPEDFDTRVRSISLSYRYDTRNNVFNATRGWFFQSTYELAGSFLAGTDAFSRIVSEVKWFHALRSNTVLATSLEAGWMDRFGDSPDVPLTERFYTGGPYTIRGFPYHELGPTDAKGEPTGGKFKIVWNVAELRQAIWRWIGVVGFFDMGNVWSSAADFRLDGFRYAAGVGLRTNTPIGIVRLDYGWNLDPEPGEETSQLFLSMGQAF